MDMPVSEIENILLELDYEIVEIPRPSETAIKILNKEEIRRRATRVCPKCREGTLGKNGCTFCGWGE